MKQEYMKPTVTVLPEDRRLLSQMCEADLRPAPHQVAWLIRQEAQRRGLLPQEDRNRAQVLEAGGAVAK